MSMPSRVCSGAGRGPTETGAAHPTFCVHDSMILCKTSAMAEHAESNRESADAQLLRQLKDRCMGFGIDATDKELVQAGLLLLAQQTETALEVAMLQSLRADRSFAPRSKRRR